MERGLIGDYESGIDRLASELSHERLALAVKIASIPDQIRGYGPVKEAAVAAAKASETELWKAWGAAASL
jgi:indolepyruvate ferredoxin oxidoreductase